jgi:phenylpyruvate tautomerase PptA (4-oxalocrotonate tautomerase family)
MPHVQTTLGGGAHAGAETQNSEPITNVLIEDGRAKRENIPAAFHDVAATNYTEAGVLVADQKTHAMRAKGAK